MNLFRSKYNSIVLFARSLTYFLKATSEISSVICHSSFVCHGYLRTLVILRGNSSFLEQSYVVSNGKKNYFPVDFCHPNYFLGYLSVSNSLNFGFD